MARHRIPLERLTWSRWRRAVRMFARSPDAGGRAQALFAALLGLLLAINGLTVVNSCVGLDFMAAIEQRSMGHFLGMAALHVGVFAAPTITAVIYRFTEERFALPWREWLRESSSNPAHHGRGACSPSCARAPLWEVDAGHVGGGVP